MHEAKLAKMEAEMKMVFQQKVQEKESKLKQSEEELYARHKEMKEALEKQRLDLEEKKRKLESGRPITPEKGSVSSLCICYYIFLTSAYSKPGGRVSFELKTISQEIVVFGGFRGHSLAAFFSDMILTLHSYLFVLPCLQC